MAEEIAARDAYARQIEADVVAVTDDGLVLDPTVFYARGGGQPGDQGLVRWPGGEVRVVDTVRKGGTTVHVYEGSPPAPGIRVVAEIDWDRRYLLMRTHTALHALSAIIWRNFDAKVTGGNMEPGTARMDFELEGISVEFGQQVEDKLNEELAADHPVEILFLPRCRGARRPGFDPDQGQSPSGLHRSDSGRPHHRSRQASGRRNPRRLYRRSRCRTSCQDRVEGQSQQANPH